MMNLGLMDPAFLGSLNTLWTPANISTALWLDAADSSTLAIVNGLVNQWRDKSGNNQHAGEAINGTFPTYSTSQLNGLPGIVFNGVSNKLSSTTMSFGLEYTVYVVCRLTTASGYKRIFSISPDAVGYVGAIEGNYATFFGVSNSTWNDTAVNTPTQAITASSIVGVVKGNGTGLAVPYFNGVAQNTKNGTTVATTSGYTIGGHRTTTDQCWTGPIYEIIIANVLHSTALRQQAEGYLAHKWGLTASLPSDHPYKVSPP